MSPTTHTDHRQTATPPLGACAPKWRRQQRGAQTGRPRRATGAHHAPSRCSGCVCVRTDLFGTHTFCTHKSVSPCRSSLHRNHMCMTPSLHTHLVRSHHMKVSVMREPAVHPSTQIQSNHTHEPLTYCSHATRQEKQTSLPPSLPPSLCLSRVAHSLAQLDWYRTQRDREKGRRQCRRGINRHQCTYAHTHIRRQQTPLRWASECTPTQHLHTHTHTHTHTHSLPPPFTCVWPIALSGVTPADRSAKSQSDLSDIIGDALRTGLLRTPKFVPAWPSQKGT